VQQEAEADREEGTDGALRLRIPSLDELKDIFTEETGASEGEDGGTEEQGGEDGAPDDEDAAKSDGPAVDDAASETDNRNEEGDGDDENEQARIGPGG
jgi:hypothetical protein